jgi:hypothetical protein
MTLAERRRRSFELLNLRARLHEKLDEVLDMYEAGDPLWIVTEMSWSGDRVADGCRITISERDL